MITRNTHQADSEQWRIDRAGKFTGSEMHLVMARREVGTKDTKRLIPYEAYWDIVDRIVVERLTGMPAGEEFSSAATRHGREVEPLNLAEYERRTGYFVEQVGFIKHPKYPAITGASPDGLVADSENGPGGVEAKSPKDPMVHLDRLRNGMPPEMLAQCHACIWATGATWWDWTSYSPAFALKNPDLAFIRVRVMRDESILADMERKVLQAEAEVQKRLRELREKYPSINL
ncbi:lambda exonuclease family protein [Uliginosibacterium sediminicola]|uniref:Lambda exonuclease family protein n=1 Tax=Uliginosibacterium sediminicola TaxID=2024550 RepID=A0ABU9YW53_9RHOO